MARLKLRSEREVVERCSLLRDQLRAALRRLAAGNGEPEVVDAVWQGEGLGTLLWALQLAELPAYDDAFEPEEVAAAVYDDAELRDAEEIGLELESARLWHWRARTTELQDDAARLPDRYASFDQLVASVAMRGYEQGLLPPPVRGDFPAFAVDYRRLTREQHAEAHAIAAERHRALGWLTAPGTRWEDVPLDT